MNGLVGGLLSSDLKNVINTPWIDFSEQSTIVGWSSYTTKIIRYKVVGKIVFVTFEISGTSNSSTTTFTLPYSNKLNSPIVLFLLSALNNNATAISRGGLSQSNNIVTFEYFTAINTISTFTSSGIKTIRGEFFYEID